MLKTLTIENYALIEKSEVVWNNGFSVITGETGSGKSIMLGALGLIQGNRADVKVLRDPEKKCVVEARFDISKYGLKTFFEENELDYDEECVIRREITPNGKSRAFVNDTPASTTQLKELSAFLIDIHSQHATLLLSKDSFQLQVLDAIARTEEKLKTYGQEYQTYVAKKNNLEKLKAQIENQNANRDYIEYQLKQLQEAHFTPTEQEELETETSQLSHTTELKEVLEQAQWQFTEKDEAMCSMLKEIEDKMQTISDVYPEVGEWKERLNTTLVELKDLAREMEMKLADVTVDPQRLEFINNRLDLIYTIEKKHKVGSLQEVLDLQHTFEEQIATLDNSEEHTAELEAEIVELEKNLESRASEISEMRKASKTILSEAVCDILHNLGMVNANFQVEVDSLPHLTADGKDKVNFMFVANKNGTLQPISSVASGGELSRVMLALKSILSKHKNLPTIIMDEIDTGVSGEVANRMGKMMRQMGEFMQVVSITHLPQIAAQSTTHYKVYKEDDENETLSHIKMLDGEEKVQEIAQMLSGTSLTEAALENARELMK